MLNNYTMHYLITMQYKYEMINSPSLPKSPPKKIEPWTFLNKKKSFISKRWVKKKKKICNGNDKSMWNWVIQRDYISKLKNISSHNMLKYKKETVSLMFYIRN